MNRFLATRSIALLAMLTGCVSAPPVDRVQVTVLCSNRVCTPIDANNATRSIQSIKKLIYDGLSREFTACEASGPNSPCTSNDLGMFVLGGPIPGRGALKAASFLSVTDGPVANSLNLRIALRETFIGTPLVCSHADGTLTLSGAGKVVLEFAPHYCNWALVGNVFTSFSMVIDRIDLNDRLVTGYYSLATTGTGNGAGSGYAALRIPDGRLDFNTLQELDTLIKTNATNRLTATDTPAPAAAPQPEGDKVALVIGNAGYRSSPLQNTRNDAKSMAASLKALGFRQTVLIDANHDLMESGLRAFMEQARSSAIALVYYAGHGIEINGRNYLVGTDVDMSSPQQVLSHSIDATEMLSALGIATPGAKILILDACRDNPFPERFRRQAHGLAQIEAPVETFIAFSTSPGKVAEDGSGSNSPYTKALIARLDKENSALEAIFRDVRKSVVNETNGRQTPWENTSLTAEIKLSAP